jgi:hypothetical protein
MQSRAYKRGEQDSPRPKPNNGILAIHSWGRAVCRGSVPVGYVTVCDRGWGGFTTTGELISVSHSEETARRAVLARGARECEQ